MTRWSPLHRRKATIFHLHFLLSPFQLLPQLPIVLPKLKDNKGETDGKVDAHQDEHVAKSEPDEAVEGDVQKVQRKKKEKEGRPERM